MAEGTISSWEQRLVYEREPIYVTPAERKWLPAGAVVMNSAEVRENHVIAPLDLFDSYDLYRMDRRGMEVAFLTPAEIWDLSDEARQELMALQAARGRGQIYTEGFLRKAEATLVSGGRDRFVAADGISRVALRYDVWQSLSPADQRRWLLHFVSEGRNSCMGGDLPADQWERYTEAHGEQVRLLASAFHPISGPNCFATVLAAATRSNSQALSIAGHWLHPEPFLRGLTERGYEMSSIPAEPEALPPGAVLLFVDSERRPQHTAFYLGDGLALNKDGQAWFIPRQVRPVAEVLATWASDEMRAITYIRR